MDFWTSVIVSWYKRGLSAKEIADMFRWEESNVQRVIDDYLK